MIRSFIGRALAALAALSFVAAPVLAQSTPTAASLSVKDGGGASQSLYGFTLNNKFGYGMWNLDAAGNIMGVPANPFSNVLYCPVIAEGTNAAYAAGTSNLCTLTTTGRLRVGLSSAALLGGTAALYADLLGAIDPSGNQASAKVNGNGDITTANRSGIFFNGATGSGSALAASATYTGPARDSGIVAGTPHPYSYFNSFFLADQTGTAYVDCSNDGTTFYVCSSTALAANTPVFISVPVLTRFFRNRVLNGSTAEGSLYVNGGFTGG